MDLPDVLGLPIAEARHRLAEAGAPQLCEQPTVPPRRTCPGGVSRVVQQRPEPDRVVLVTAAFPALPQPEATTTPEPSCD